MHRAAYLLRRVAPLLMRSKLSGANPKEAAMNRSKFSTKALMLAGALGLSVATLGAAQPAAAQDYTCPAGTYYDPTYGCTSGGYIYPYSDYSPYGYGFYGHRDFDHGMGGFHGGGFHGGMAGGFHGGGGGGHR